MKRFLKITQDCLIGLGYASVLFLAPFGWWTGQRVHWFIALCAMAWAGKRILEIVREYD